MPSFGGDQITALVFDLGTNLSRAGFAGMDAPSVVVPSAVGRAGSVVLGDMTGKPLRDMDIVQPFQDGIVSDWDALEQVWEYCNTLLGVDASEHALMYSEPSWNPKEQREQLCQLAFEKFNVPGFYLGRSAVLASFAAGRSTALVVDSGASLTSVVPVFDGYIIKKAIEKSPIGGDFISAQVLSYLESVKIDTTPQCFVKSKQIVDSTKTPRYQLHQLDGITDSFKMFAKMRLIHTFKEATCHIAESPFDEKVLKKRPPKKFEFPTGFNTSFGAERYKFGESLFQASFAPPTMENVSTIPQLIHSSISKCDADLRPHMHGNVVLTGANTLMHGFADRVYMELHYSSPGVHQLTQSKVKVSAAGGSSERKFGPWIGGSILASLDNFAPLWISKQQYEEEGVSVEAKIQ